MPASFTTSAGKFGRTIVAGTALAGNFEWGAQHRRERLDTTNFESVVSADGTNVYSEGITGPLDSTFSTKGVVNTTQISLLFMASSITCSFLFSKTPAFGYSGILCDVLEFSPGTSSRGRAEYTSSLQSSGLVAVPA